MKLPILALVLTIFTVAALAQSGTQFSFTARNPSKDVMNQIDLSLQEAPAKMLCRQSYTVFSYRSNLRLTPSYLRLSLATTPTSQFKDSEARVLYEAQILLGQTSSVFRLSEPNASELEMYAKELGILFPRLSQRAALQPGNHRLSFTLKLPKSSRCVYVDLTVPVFRTLQ